MVDFLEPIEIDTPAFAELYDELPLWSAPFGLWLLEHCPLGPCQTVLDLGAGTGFATLELAERCGPASTVIAVDPWEAAMAQLRRKVAQRRLSNVRLLLQDAASVDLPEHSVDVFVSNLGVNNFADPAAVMRGCARLAKPGATFVLTTNLVGHMAEFYEVYRRVLVETGQGDRLAALERHVQHRATVDGVRSLLEDAGFATVQVAEFGFSLRFANGSALLRHHFIRMGFLPGWAQVVPADRVPATFAALERALDAEAARCGELRLTIPAAGFVARRSPG